MAPTNNNEFVKKSDLDVAINGLKDELKVEFKEDLRLQLEALTKSIKDSLTPQQPSTELSNTTNQNSSTTNNASATPTTPKIPTTLPENITTILPKTINPSSQFLNQPYNTNSSITKPSSSSLFDNSESVDDRFLIAQPLAFLLIVSTTG
ncbi:hypothetical protein FRX31_012628 [Thalictrum thalictroides]|uniref:Uncharacterized protein n=1 Tax=Thalictrum thalictroides TaxID=46969 RepID=A0A7J6WMV6_THATH|nr:hypothetical protein FRX31_012628 [Thalictrum thalictroides]